MNVDAVTCSRILQKNATRKIAPANDFCEQLNHSSFKFYLLDDNILSVEIKIRHINYFGNG